MLASLLFMAAACAAQSVTIGTETLQGATCDTTDSQYWLKVPYAQPPTGTLRAHQLPIGFQDPVLYNGSYGGEYTTITPQCLYTVATTATGPASEDCLYVDIYAPPNAKDLPVKVWLYGGANSGGTISFPMYNSCNLADAGAVVVLVNYRVGPWGFLAIESYGITGNYGIKDQVLALQWIQENIASFGGDKSKVVIFGQSAGALDTSIIGSLDIAPSILKAGISESGGGQFIFNISHVSDAGLKYAKKVDCDSLACLQAKPALDLNVTVYTDEISSLTKLGSGVEGFGPNIDGKLLRDQPVRLGVKVPWIFGTTTQEASIFVGLVGQPSTFTPSVYNASVKALYGQSTLDLYPLSDFSADAYPGFVGEIAIFTDVTFRCTSFNALNTAYKIGTPAWAYLWGQPSTCIPAALASPSMAQLATTYAGHGSEVQFVFANVYAPPEGQNCSFTPAEQSLSRQFVDLWTSMAETGTPGNETWPQYDPDANTGFIVDKGSAWARPGVIDFSKCGYWNQRYTSEGFQ